MRKALSKSEGERKKFRGTFSRLGKKPGYLGYAEETLLLTNIVDLATGKNVTGHIWFTYTKGFQQIKLAEGTVLEFEARVKRYSKGYINRSLQRNQQQTDFKLSHPTKIKLAN